MPRHATQGSSVVVWVSPDMQWRPRGVNKQGGDVNPRGEGPIRMLVEGGPEQPDAHESWSGGYAITREKMQGVNGEGPHIGPEDLQGPGNLHRGLKREGNYEHGNLFSSTSQKTS
ncbi:hypothetical protein P7K49_008841 [Saguinus oedipus]|uniref:Uncharacterized protein n=1 Tax=Saguinus oedipus TaxID=9490 RepID=A0ABQ9VYV3_SAGOE|nr:hypothetical protein P7K49_008841 [Saguinus oedipus]